MSRLIILLALVLGVALTLNMGRYTDEDEYGGQSLSVNPKSVAGPDEDNDERGDDDESGDEDEDEENNREVRDTDTDADEDEEEEREVPKSHRMLRRQTRETIKKRQKVKKLEPKEEFKSVPQPFLTAPSAKANNEQKDEQTFDGISEKESNKVTQSSTPEKVERLTANAKVNQSSSTVKVEQSSPPAKIDQPTTPANVDQSSSPAKATESKSAGTLDVPKVARVQQSVAPVEQKMETQPSAPAKTQQMRPIKPKKHVPDSSSPPTPYLRSSPSTNTQKHSEMLGGVAEMRTVGKAEALGAVKGPEKAQEKAVEVVAGPLPTNVNVTTEQISSTDAQANNASENANNNANLTAIAITNATDNATANATVAVQTPPQTIIHAPVDAAHARQVLGIVKKRDLNEVRPNLPQHIPRLGRPAQEMHASIGGIGQVKHDAGPVAVTGYSYQARRSSTPVYVVPGQRRAALVPVASAHFMDKDIELPHEEPRRTL